MAVVDMRLFLLHIGRQTSNTTVLNFKQMIVCKADCIMHGVEGVLPKDAMQVRYGAIEI